MLERHYLEQIAAASWRLRRLHRWRSSARTGSQAQVYEDPGIDEDARMDKLDKTLRHETMLTRQSIRSNGRRTYRAVRLLHRDLSELFADRAREDTLGRLGRTESECRTSPGLAAQAERIARRAVQAVADEPPLIGGLDPTRLDNVHIPPPGEMCENESCENESCENEICQNEICQNEHPASARAAAPNPPVSGGPQRSGEVGRGEAGPDYLRRCFLTGQRYRNTKNAKTNPPHIPPPDSDVNLVHPP